MGVGSSNPPHLCCGDSRTASIGVSRWSDVSLVSLVISVVYSSVKKEDASLNIFSDFVPVKDIYTYKMERVLSEKEKLSSQPSKQPTTVTRNRTFSLFGGDGRFDTFL